MQFAQGLVQGWQVLPDNTYPFTQLSHNDAELQLRQGETQLLHI